MVAIDTYLDDALYVDYLGQRYARDYGDGAYCGAISGDRGEGLEAERAFADAFVETARQIERRWTGVDAEAIEAAWQARLRAAERAEVWIPSADYFGVTDPAKRQRMDSDQIAYRLGHRPEASRLRGIHHAMVYVEQAWEELEIESWELFAAFVLRRWIEAVDQWARAPFELGCRRPPPRPAESLTDRQFAALGGPLPETPAAPDPIVATIHPSYRSVSDLVLDHPRMKRPIIEGLLREGETMNVIASPKMGKSWLVTDLALSVATGRPWLGYACRGGDVLILDNELHGATTAHRVPRVAEARGVPLGEFGGRVFVDNLRGRLTDILSLSPYFGRVEANRFSVIILDALYRFLPPGTDENDNGAMANIYNAIDRYAQRLGSAFVLIHHTTKGGQWDKSVTDVGAGAGSQSRAADAHLVLRPHKEDEAVVLDAAVRSWPPIEPRCLRWGFPVFSVAADLDPADLRGARRRKNADKGASEPQWTPQRFAEAFVNHEPADRETILLASTGAGLSRRLSASLLSAAEDAGLAHRWKFGARRKVKFAAAPQESGDARSDSSVHARTKTGAHELDSGNEN
ncbi:MAG: AAA family ATPase [Phycisphaera sp.]|nr:AAA family ATPase [Phycisphaera sp.]